MKKYKELFLYLVFGVLTTLVNFVVFATSDAILGANAYLVSNAIAWIVSVVFAYITNKLCVFASKSFAIHVFLKEFVEFLLARAFSFVVEEFGMWLLIGVLDFGKFTTDIWGVSISGQLLAKGILAVIVVVMNYFFSKFIIFKNNN